MTAKESRGGRKVAVESRTLAEAQQGTGKTANNRAPIRQRLIESRTELLAKDPEFPLAPCSKCEEPWPEAEAFYPSDPRTRTGHDVTCRACKTETAARMRVERTLGNPELLSTE